MLRALITGCTGQDGTYLSRLLLDRGYEVHGMVRRASDRKFNPLFPKDAVTLHGGDLTDTASLRRTIEEARPHEVYNLAAQSDVAESFRQPEYTADATGVGALRLLEVVYQYVKREKEMVRYYHRAVKCSGW